MIRLHATKTETATNDEAHRRSGGVDAVLVKPAWRTFVASLATISGASLLAVLAVLLWSEEGPHNPLQLMRWVGGLCLLPGLAAALLRWAFQARVRISAGTLVLEQRHERTEIPIANVTAVEPWILPLPGSGLWLRLRSGRRWSDGVQMDDPAVLIEALVGAGAATTLAGAVKHPSMVYARAAARRGRPRSWQRLLLKFPVFALVPTLPLFRVHQLIAYGGVFGEYYQYGLGAYLSAFAIYWSTLTIYLMLYGAALRVPVEVLAMAAAFVDAEHAVDVRRILERFAALAFYVGVPVAVVLRFIPW